MTSPFRPANPSELGALPPPSTPTETTSPFRPATPAEGTAPEITRWGSRVDAALQSPPGETTASEEPVEDEDDPRVIAWRFHQWELECARLPPWKLRPPKPREPEDPLRASLPQPTFASPSDPFRPAPARPGAWAPIRTRFTF
jgi:hypothetical protein